MITKKPTHEKKIYARKTTKKSYPWPQKICMNDNNKKNTHDNKNIYTHDHKKYVPMTTKKTCNDHKKMFTNDCRKYMTTTTKNAYS